jgi:hypothetical protein
VRFEKRGKSFNLPTFYIDFEEVDMSMTWLERDEHRHTFENMASDAPFIFINDSRVYIGGLSFGPCLS